MAEMGNLSMAQGELVGKDDDKVISMDGLLAALPKEPVEEPANNEVEQTKDQETSITGIKRKVVEEFSERRLSRELRLGLLQSYPIIWIGDLLIANLKVRVAFKFIYGDIALFEDAVPPCTVADPGILLYNRLKFEDAAQEVVEKNMQAQKGSCVLIAVPLNLRVKECNRMEKYFISYLQRNGSVGVSHFPLHGIPDVNSESDSSTSTTYWKDNSNKFKYEMISFPRSTFVYQNLLPIAPTLAERLYKDQCPHLMLVIRNQTLTEEKKLVMTFPEIKIKKLRLYE